MGLPNPITTIGGGVESIGKGLGGIATSSSEWLGDRTKDVVSGDVFGIHRRENEELRETIDEKLKDSNATLTELRDQIDSSELTGKTGGPEMTKSVSAFLHGQDGSTGALAKSLDATHTVVEGDTLSEIAEDKGKSVEDLLGLNPELGDGNLIRPGQEIKLDDFVAQGDPAAELQTAATPSVTPPQTDTEMQV